MRRVPIPHTQILLLLISAYCSKSINHTTFEFPVLIQTLHIPVSLEDCNGHFFKFNSHTRYKTCSICFLVRDVFQLTWCSTVSDILLEMIGYGCVYTSYFLYQFTWWKKMNEFHIMIAIRMKYTEKKYTEMLLEPVSLIQWLWYSKWTVRK